MSMPVRRSRTIISKYYNIEERLSGERIYTKYTSAGSQGQERGRKYVNRFKGLQAAKKTKPRFWEDVFALSCGDGCPQQIRALP
jgi:hypothetical protein